MRNYKLAKTAVALILGASVVTSAVVPTDASAASKYKIKSGKLVVAKTGKTAAGYVTYKKTLYKSGKKYTGLKSKIYYKSGKKATGTYKGAYYKTGAKKVTTGTYNKAYYVKGVKKVATGLYASKYYKEGKLATGTYKSTYYVNGVKKATTGYYNGAYYVKGVKKVTTGIYNKQYYVKGKLSKGLVVYKEQLYKDGSLNKDLALFKDELYDGATLSKGIKVYKDAAGLELFYNDEKLANGTFFINEKEEAFENGVKVGAKVSAVEAINGTTIEVKFNKAVDKDDAESVKVKDAIKIGTAAVSTTSLSEDGRTLTITFTTPLNLKEATVEIPGIKTKADAAISTPKFLETMTYTDTVSPTVISAASAIAKITDTVTNKVTVKFSEPVQPSAIAYVNDANVSVSQGDNKNELILTLGVGAKVGDILNVKLTNVKDLTGNAILPNPADISTIVLAADSTAPVVTSVTTKSVTAGLNVTFNFNKKVTAASIDASKTYLSANGINVGKLETPVVSADSKSVTYKVTLTDGTAVAAFEKDGKFTANLYVQEALVLDEAGNKSAASNQSITFTKDAIAPALISSEFKDNKLVLNFNEAVTVVDAKKVVKVIAYNAQTGYESILTDADLKLATVSNDGKTLAIDLGVKAGAEEKTYKVSFVKGALIDDSSNEVAAYNEIVVVKKLAVTTTKDTANPTVSLAGIAATPTGDNYVIKFNVKDEKGVASEETQSGLDFSTILNSGNYTLAGKALPFGTKISTDVADANIFAKDGTVEVTLTIPKTSIPTDLFGPLTATGIKDRNGNTLVTIVASDNLSLKEGVAPTLKTAIIGLDNHIVLGFSEPLVDLPKASDFIVKVNDKTIAIDPVTIATGSDAGKYLINLKKLVKDGNPEKKEAGIITGTGADKVKVKTLTSAALATAPEIYTVNVTGDGFDGRTGITITAGAATITQGNVTFEATGLVAGDTFTLETTELKLATEAYLDVDDSRSFDSNIDIQLGVGIIGADYSLLNSPIIKTITVETKKLATGELATKDNSNNALTQGTVMKIK